MASVKIPEVSVILPVHNAADTLVRAIESIQNQTSADYELIVVDCASTDRSAALVERMAERDIHIELISSDTSSLAQARNLGLERAHGIYLCFLDATDWLVPTTFEELIPFARANELELLLSGFSVDVYADEGSAPASQQVRFPSDVYLDRSEFRMEARKLFERDMLLAVWNIIMLRSCVEEAGLRFQDVEHGSAQRFVLDAIRDVEHVGVVEDVYYHCSRWRSEEKDDWDTSSYNSCEQEHEELLALYNYWGLDGDPANFEMIERRYIEQLLGCIEDICSPRCTLALDEKRALIESIITSEPAQLAAQVAYPRSTTARMLISPIRRQDVSMTYSESRVLALLGARYGRRLASLDEY